MMTDRRWFRIYRASSHPLYISRYLRAMCAVHEKILQRGRERAMASSRRGSVRFAFIVASSTIFFFVFFCSALAETMGICYGRVADNLPPAEQVVNLLRANNIGRVRIFDADPAVLQAFADSGIELVTALPNEQLQAAAESPEAAAQWVGAHIRPFVPATRIAYIAVGNEILVNNAQYSPYLLPAMQNIQNALEAMNLEGSIKVSTPHAASVLGTSFPPSRGAFHPAVAATVAPILDFLARTGAPFMANVYPFFSYVDDPQEVPLDFALFASAAPAFSDGGLSYANLFDATVDSFVSAMETAGYPGIPIAVTESGWPWAGGSDGAASPENALAYNSNLIRHVLSDVGTPRRPGLPVPTFLFGLFNEDDKPGPNFERCFGLFFPSCQKVYDIDFNPPIY